MRRATATALLIDPETIPRQVSGEVDPGVLALVRDLRAAGRPVASAGGADGGPAGEVPTVGVDGAPRRSKAYFVAACRALGLPPDRVLFLTGEEWAVRGARVAGLAAYRWTGPDDVRYLRSALGL
ncbi:MAG TPA: hypothetical protein VES42_27585 [Pilimelia sp.]|nr:hypothetical protein [Pilimelia sp.]